jgi:hypothetical protein
MKTIFTLAVFMQGLSLGILIGRFMPDVQDWLERRVRLWKARHAYKPKPYEVFTPEHHRPNLMKRADVPGNWCRQCSKPSEHPIHLHPHKVWSAETLDNRFGPPGLGTIAAVLHAALTVDWGAKMYTLEDRWPGVLFAEPSQPLNVDHLPLLAAIEPHRCMGVLVRLVGCATPELPMMNFYEVAQSSEEEGAQEC